MAAADLTTLAAVKSWLGIDLANEASDQQLKALIAAMSRAVYALLNRPTLFSHVVTERRDGHGGPRLLVREWPVISVASLTVDGVAIPAAASSQAAGWLLEPADGPPPGRMQSLDLFGSYAFGRGRQNVVLTYSAGYAVSAEAQTVANGAVLVNTPYGSWGADGGVVYAAGTALTRVAGTPAAAGQYQLDAATPGKYIFNAADNGQAVLISYSYVPADVFQVATELVGERWKYKGRIGEVSKTLGGQETVTFSQKDIPSTMRLMLQNYINVVPA